MHLFGFHKCICIPKASTAHQEQTWPILSEATPQRDTGGTSPDTGTVEVGRAGTRHVVRTYCVLGEVGRAWPRMAPDQGSKSVPAAVRLCDWGQGAHLSELPFLHMRRGHGFLVAWVVWCVCYRAAALSPHSFLTV